MSMQLILAIVVAAVGLWWVEVNKDKVAKWNFPTSTDPVTLIRMGLLAMLFLIAGEEFFGKGWIQRLLLRF